MNYQELNPQFRPETIGEKKVNKWCVFRLIESVNEHVDDRGNIKRTATIEKRFIASIRVKDDGGNAAMSVTYSGESEAIKLCTSGAAFALVAAMSHHFAEEFFISRVKV